MVKLSLPHSNMEGHLVGIRRVMESRRTVFAEKFFLELERRVKDDIYLL